MDTVFNNDAQVNEIRFTKDITLFCPIADGYYHAIIEVEIIPDKKLVDYIVIDKFLISLEGKAFIIENVLKEIYNYMVSKYEPIYAKITLSSNSNMHMPVTVIKETVKKTLRE